jgi:hypothetical protein
MIHNCVGIISPELQLELETSQRLLESIGTPRAITVWMLVRHGMWQELVDLECNPYDYLDHQHFADDYQATELLKKSPNLPLGIDRKQAALNSFWESETRCGETNKRILGLNGRYPPKLERARRLIRKVLGPLNRERLDYIEAHMRFGPGATTGVKGSGSVLSDKYDAEMHLTQNLIPFYRALLGHNWWDIQSQPEVVLGNRFTTVPKNAKTDRGICIEPTLNIFGQLGIGAGIRKALLRLGIDLTSQERNQRLAAAAFQESLATIDLSAASDSLAWSVVMDFIPGDWFELLDLFRSPFSEVNGETVELEKFSSMGNGYTFELETLLFAALAFTVVPIEDHHKVSVYGDDIIVPSYAAADVIDALEFLGFRVNEKKSFLAGSFFESCGTDWFLGRNVRPFYLRKEKDTGCPYSVQIANAVRLYAHRRCGGVCCDSRFRDLWVYLYKRSPRAWRGCRVPPHMGDVGFVSDKADVNLTCVGRTDRFFGWEGWRVRFMHMSPKKLRKKSLGRMLAALSCPAPEIATRGFEPRRGYLNQPVSKWTVVYHWSEGFLWC